MDLVSTLTSLFDSAEVLYPNEIETVDIEKPWVLPLLINHDNNRYWQVGYSNDKLFRLVGTKNTTNTYELDVVPKQKRTHSQQAFLIAKKKYNDKIKEGYVVNDLDYQEHRDIVLIHEPMLANNYMYNDETGMSNVDTFPVAVQPKLDGVRMLAYYNDDGELIFSSRKSSNFIYTEDHWVGMREEIEMFLELLPEGTQLDGELYSRDLSFLQIVSIVKSKKRVHEDIDLIQYFMFDIVFQNDMMFEERHEVLVDTYNRLNEVQDIKYLVIVDTRLVDSIEELDIEFKKYEDEGYEGMMIRKLGEGTQYVSGRTNNLLKRKSEYEEEITITDVLECQGNEKGLCKIVGVRDSGETVTVRPAASFEERRMYLEEKDKLIGKRYTIIYNEINPNTGVPRFPRGKGFRDYE